MVGAAMRSTHSLGAHLLVWLLVPAVEVYLSHAHPVRHTPWQLVLEFSVFGALGTLQWRFAGAHWLGSLYCAGLLPVLVALFVHMPSGWVARSVYGIGALLLTSALLKDAGRSFEERGRGGAALALGALVAVLGPLAAHAMDLQKQVGYVGGRMGDQARSLWSQYREQLLWPLRERGASEAQSDGPPVVLVTVDTLRADHAREMESHRWLAERGRWWPSAMSTSSWTLPAIASIQTGLLPGEHGATCLYDAHCQGLQHGRTLAQDLAERGYRTASLTANPWISDATTLTRGYQRTLDFGSLRPIRLAVAQGPSGPPSQDAGRIVDAALGWLEEAPRRGTLLWIHLIDPHMPYHQTPALSALTARKLRLGASTSAEARARVLDAYRREVDHVDRQLLRLFEWLEGDGFLERGLLVLTSDHGEEFWEHGGVEHGHSHHAEVVEVPLAIAGRGVVPGRAEGVASLVDIAPTVRAAVGLPAGGIDLRQPVPGGRIATAHGVMIGPLTRSARDDSTRVIVRGDSRFEPLVVRRFDLAEDPAERAPGPPERDDPVARAALETRGPASGEELHVNEQALRALGYVQ